MNRIILLFILVGITFGTGSFLPMWTGKNIIIAADTVLYSCNLLPDDNGIRNIGAPDLGFAGVYADSIFGDFIGSNRLFVSGNDTVGVWYNDNVGNGAGIKINPASTDDTLDFDFWIADSCGNSVNRNGEFIWMRGGNILKGQVFDLVTKADGKQLYGTHRMLNGGGNNSIVYGEYNDIVFHGSGDKSYGQYTYIHRLDGTGDVVGQYNKVENEDVGAGSNMYGIYNELCPCGLGKHVGIFTLSGGWSGTDSVIGTGVDLDGTVSTNDNEILGFYSKVIGETGDSCVGVYTKASGGSVNYAMYSDGDNYTNGYLSGKTVLGLTDTKHILLVDDDFQENQLDSTHFNNFWEAMDRANALTGECVVYLYPGLYDTSASISVGIRGNVHIIGVGGSRDSIIIHQTQPGETPYTLYYLGGGRNIIKNVTIRNTQDIGGNCVDCIFLGLTTGPLDFTAENCVIDGRESSVSFCCSEATSADSIYSKIVRLINCKFPASKESGVYLNPPKVIYDSLAVFFVKDCEFWGDDGIAVKYLGRGLTTFENCFFDSVTLVPDDWADTLRPVYVQGYAKRSLIQGWTKNTFIDVMNLKTEVSGGMADSVFVGYRGIAGKAKWKGKIEISQGQYADESCLESGNIRSNQYTGYGWYLNNASTGIGIGVLNGAGGIAFKATSNTGTGLFVWGDASKVGTGVYVGYPGLNKGFVADAYCDTALDITGLSVLRDSAAIGKLNFGVDAGSSDDYVVAISGLTALGTGTPIWFKANTANTGACTVNPTGLGVKSLKSLHDQDPADNYIEVGSIVHAVYDGTNFQIMNPDANP